jgi:excisionase family DNA binding protein
MTVEEVAEFLRYSPQHVRCLLKRGELKGCRTGKKWWIKTDWIQSHFKRKLRSCMVRKGTDL